MPDRPLIVTSDAELLDELLRLCAAAGVDAQVADDVGAARPRWSGPPLVVVGGDLARAAASGELPRRRDVLVVSAPPVDPDLWDHATTLGADSVVLLPDARSWLVERLGEAVDGPLTEAVTVAVVGGRGGAGATTLAAALATTAARAGLRAMLVDADPLGGGIDLVLGGEDAAGLRWPDLASGGGRVSGRALRESLPSVAGARGLMVLSCDRTDARTVPAQAMRSVLAAGGRSNDLLVLDVPRHPDGAGDLALASAGLTVLVVPAEVRATAAASRVAARVAQLSDDIRVVVRGPAPAGLTGPVVAEALGLPLLAWLRPEPGLSLALERGEPPARTGRGPLAKLCRGLLTELGVAGRSAA